MTLRGEYVLDEAVRYAVVDGEAVVVQQRSGEVITLNKSATILLDGIEAGMNSTEVLDAFINRFDVDAEIAEKDIADCCEELHDIGILALSR